MTTITNLIQATTNKKQGNHRKEIKGIFSNYIYHSSIICTVDEIKKTFYTNNCGYGTRSTTRAINEYKRQLTMQGYQLVS